MPDAVLVLVGGGEDAEQLRAQVGRLSLDGRVLFAGHVTHVSVRFLLAVGDVSVDPVRDDDVARARSPLKLFESFAIGVPVVTAPVGDRSAILGAGGGILAADATPGALALALYDALAQPAQLAEMARVAEQRACLYDWSLLAERWLKVYNTH
jgi:glycosyltransferase involved in cell wall biosynthesis